MIRRFRTYIRYEETMASLEIQRQLTLNANTQTVYDLISTPAGMAQWFSDEAEATDDGFVVTWRNNGKTECFEAVVVDRAPQETFAYRTIEDMPTITRFILTDKSQG